jgi:hypothetical protein
MYDPRPHHAPRCRVTGKEMFETKQAAKNALAAYAYAKGSRKVHRCIFCDCYHTTKGVRGRPGKCR